MAETSKYNSKPYSITQKGLSDILNPGKEEDTQDIAVQSMPGGVFQLVGSDSEQTPVLADESTLPIHIAGGGLTTQQAIKKAYESGFEQEAQTISNIQQAKPFEEKEYYNEAAFAQRQVGNVLSGIAKAKEQVGDFVYNDILGGRAYRSASNSVREDSWVRAVQDASLDNDESFKNFSENMVIEVTTESGNEESGNYKKSTTWTRLNDLENAYEFANMDLDRLRVSNGDGTYRKPNKKELEWAKKYQNLNKSRVLDEQAATVANAFGEQFADGLTWYDNWTDARGDAYTTSRKYANVIGGAIGSALPYELIGVGPFALVNVGGRVVKAGSIAKALATADKAWRGSRLTNPFILSQGGGILARGTSIGSSFVGSYAQEYMDMKDEALAAGWDYQTARQIASKTASLNALIETVDYHTFAHRYLMGGKSWSRFLFKGGPAEGSEEVLQSLWENKVRKEYGLDYLTYNQIGGELWFRFVGGFAGAVGMGAAHNTADIIGNIITGDYKIAEKLAKEQNTKGLKEWILSTKDEFAPENKEDENLTSRAMQPGEVVQMKDGSLSPMEQAARTWGYKSPITADRAIVPADVTENETPQSATLRSRIYSTFRAIARIASAGNQEMVNFLTEESEAFSKFAEENNVDRSNPEEFALAIYEFYRLQDSLPDDIDFFSLPVGVQAGMVSAAIYLKANGFETSLSKEQAQGNLEAVLLQAKAEYVRQVKAHNPGAANEELEAGWDNLSKPLITDMKTGEITEAIAREAEENFAIIKASQQAQADVKRSVFSRIQGITSRINTESIRKALTADSADQYDGQWEVATQMIEKRIMKATGDTKLAKALAAFIKKMYYNDLRATPEVTPVQFIAQAFPNIIPAAKLRRNNIYIKGISGISALIKHFDVVDDPAEFGYNKKTAQLLVDLVERYEQTQDKKEKEDLGKEILYGLFGKITEDMDAEAAVNLLNQIFNEEAQIATASAYAKLTDAKDIKTMAIMRLKGMSQKSILSAFSLAQDVSEEDVDNDYEYVVEQLFGTVTEEEIKALQNLGERIIEQENAGKEVSGIYASDEAGVNAIVLRETSTPEVATEEVIHWITVLADQIANYYDVAPLRTLGQAQIGIYENESGNETLYTNPAIRRFFDRVVDIIKKRFGNTEITREQVHETAAELIARALVDPSVDAELAELFHDILPSRKANENNEGSLYAKLTNYDKSQFKSLLKEKFAAKELNDANTRLREAQELDKQIMEARRLVDQNKEESPEYQIYQNLTSYLATRPQTIGELNNALAKMVAIYNEAQKTGKNYSGALIAQAIETVQDLQRNAYTSLLNSLFSDSSIFDIPDISFQEDWDFDKMNNGRYLSSTGDDNTTILYHKKSKRDFRTTEQKMRGFPTDARALIEQLKYFKPSAIAEAFSTLVKDFTSFAKEYHPLMGDLVRRTALELSTTKQYAANLNYRWLQAFNYYNDKAKKEGRQVIDFNDMLTYRTYLNNHQRTKAFEFMEQRMSDDPESQEMLKNMHDRIQNALLYSRTIMNKMGYSIPESKDYFPSPLEHMDDYALYKYQQFLKRDADKNDKFKMPEYLKVLGGQANTVTGKMITAKLSEISKDGKKMADENMLEFFNAVNEAIARPFDKSQSHELYHSKNLHKTREEVKRFYKDPFDSLQSYLDDVAEKIFDYRLVGRVNQEDVEKIDKNFKGGQVGRILVQAHSGSLEGFVYDQQREAAFIDAVRAILQRKAPKKDFFTETKKVASIMTIGRMFSAINQFLELGPTMYRYGFVNSLSAMVEAIKGADKSQWAYSLDSVGIQALNEVQRNDTDGLLSRLNNWFLSINFFTKADILMKNTAMVASMMHAKECIMAMREGEDSLSIDRFKKYFDDTFNPTVYNEKRRNKILDDLVEGKLTDDVRLYLRNALAMTQPIDLTEVPLAYNKFGSLGHSMYFLSTVTIKQMQFLFNDTISNFKKSPAKASAELCRMVFFCALAGIPNDWIKDVLRGKQPNIKESALYSLASYTVFNKYVFTEAKRRGLVSTLAQRYTFSATLFDDAYRAIVNKKPAEITRNIPWVEAYYNLFGPGHKNQVRHREAINFKRYSVAENLLTKQMFRKNTKFFWWEF